MHEPLRSKIVKVAGALANDPYLGKSLEGELSGLRSVRVWPFRIVYEIQDKLLLIIIIRIGHRKDVYR